VSLHRETFCGFEIKGKKKKKEIKREEKEAK